MRAQDAGGQGVPGQGATWAAVLRGRPGVRAASPPAVPHSHGGTSVDFTLNRSSLTNNHLLPIYKYAIKNRLLQIQSPIPN